MKNERSYGGAFSTIGMTAMFSIVALVGVIGWKIEQHFQDKDSALSIIASAAASDHSAIPDNNQQADYSDYSAGSGSASSSDPLAPSTISDSVASALASQYALMQESGNYSTSSAAAAAQQLGESIKADVTYKTYGPSDIKTVADTSYSSMLAYRAALQTTLEPLLKNTTPELDYLTDYEQNSDPQYLTDLVQAADNYKLAASETAAVTVPADAASVQIGILDAMQEFAAILDQMASNAKDPFAEATLLNTYMQAQNDMFTSFNNLYTYYKSKQS